MLTEISAALSELDDLEHHLEAINTDDDCSKMLALARRAHAYNLLAGIEADLIKQEKGVEEIIRQERWSGLGIMTWTIIDYNHSNDSYEVEQYFHAVNPDNEGVYDRFWCNDTELERIKNDPEYSWPHNPSQPDIIVAGPHIPLPAPPSLPLVGSSG